MQTEILVIGSGPGGSSVAIQCAKAGKKVIVVDSLFGGTCALRGCTPKKAMESITSAYWEAKAYEKAGFPILNKYVDWHTLAAHQSKFTALVPTNTIEKYASFGIKSVKGKASFIDAHTLQVGDKKIKAKTIVIATGARPRKLDIKGEELLVTNDDFFGLDHLPKKIVVVGGGYIGFEMSHIMAACGAQVTILSGSEEPLAVFEKNLVDDLVQATLAKGIEVKLGYEANKIEKQGKEFKVSCKRKDNKTFTYSTDLVIHAAGRVPAIEKLGIEKIGLKTNEKNGIKVNRFLQTKKHAHIFALGDVTGNFPFTEIANYEADIVAHNILKKRRTSVNYDGVPFSVYTHPKMAMVGKNEKDLKEAGVKYKVNAESYDHSFIQRTKLNTHARYKVLVDKKSDKILGAAVLGCYADEMMNLFAMAIQTGMKTEELKKLLLVYPTAGHEVKSLV